MAGPGPRRRLTPIARSPHRHRLFLRMARCAAAAGGSARLDFVRSAPRRCRFPRSWSMAPQQGQRHHAAQPARCRSMARCGSTQQRAARAATDEIRYPPPSSRCGPAASSWCGWCASRNRRRSKSYRLVIDEIPDPSTPAVNGVVLRCALGAGVRGRGPGSRASWEAAARAGSGLMAHNTARRWLRGGDAVASDEARRGGAAERGVNIGPAPGARPR